ncbi:MAG: hypothetical protein DCC55_39675 [Chloroflexi bacterium]|nr:MAG: hypothetical protein DCC55_39675 [Chloroflexota bacterium]
MARAGYIILERDGFRCVYCGYSPVDGDNVVLTVDHILPVAMGGPDRADNLVACCQSCNSQKQAKPLDGELRQRIADGARARNVKQGIPNDLAVNLGSTSAEKRARRRWDVLPVKALCFAYNLVANSHATSNQRGYSIARSLCFVIDMLPEYIRETGDVERAERIKRELLEMATLVRRKTEGLPETERWTRYAQGWVESALKESVTDEDIEHWLGPEAFEYWDYVYRRKGWINE